MAHWTKVLIPSWHEGFIPARSGGEKLAPRDACFLEDLLQADLSQVRLHYGAALHTPQALALASGHHVYLGFGRDEACSPRGHFILAHEIAHILQQRSGRLNGFLEPGVVQDPRLEAEANAVAMIALLWRNSPSRNNRILGEALSWLRTRWNRTAAPGQSAPSGICQPLISVDGRVFDSIDGIITANFKMKSAFQGMIKSLLRELEEMLQDKNNRYNYKSWDDLKTDLDTWRGARTVDALHSCVDVEDLKALFDAKGKRPAKGRVPGAYVGAQPGTFSIQESKDHKYPERPQTVLEDEDATGTARIIGNARVRMSMSEQTTQMMMATKQTHPTKPHKLMLKNKAKKSFSMADNNIARCHKIADSSIHSIFISVGLSIADLPTSGLLKKQKAALEQLATALGSEDDKETDEMGATLRSIAKDLKNKDHRSASGKINRLTADWSFRANNLRFGYSTVNETILYGMDPNVDSTGALTPISQALEDAINALSDADLISTDLARSILSRVTSKVSKLALTSSLNKLL